MAAPKNWYRAPSDQEISTLEGIANVLGPLSVLTDSLGTENHVTVSIITPVVNHVVNVLMKCKEDSNLLKEMKRTIGQSLES